MLDVLFTNATIVDGSGTSARKGSVGIKDGKICLDCSDGAKEVIDATGLTLTPGFIDAHSHGDLSIGTPHATLCKLCQGITTEIGGQCGLSPYPVDMKQVDAISTIHSTEYDFLNMPFDRFVDFKGYADYAESLDLTMNMASLVGHNMLRASVMGVENRPATAEELELMKARLKECMEQGAMGLSSGLIYIPGAYSTTEELVELCKVIKPFGGIYATHMRNEAKDVVKSVKESIFIAEQAGVPLVISHHKVCGKAYWGQSEETLRLVEEAIARGVKILIDQYPYEANMTQINVCIPPQYFAEGLASLVDKLRQPEWRKKIADEMNVPDGHYDNFYLNSGGFEGVFIAVSPKVPEAEGMMVADWAKLQNKDPMDAYFDLLVANEGSGVGIFFAMDINEVERIYCNPHTVVGTDGLCYSIEEKGHPRAWGSFIRPLTEFAEEKHLVSFEQAVRKQTSQTADFWGLSTKGLIKDGYDADILLIDRKALKNTATFANSNRKPEGIKAIYVGGVCVFKDNEYTGKRNGHIVKRG